MDRVPAGHEPYPALAIDRAWRLIAANRVVPPLLTGLAPELLQPPINVLRLSLHPQGLAAQIANLPHWRAHLLARLGHEAQVTADPRLEALILTAFGLVLLGVAASIVWQAQWLLLLALGIGFVEVLESSTLIAVWKQGHRTGDMQA